VGMPTRNVVLSQHQEDFLGDLVSSGTYQNASEVLREGSHYMVYRNTSPDLFIVDFIHGSRNLIKILTELVD